MILTCNKDTFNFVRIDGGSEEQMMRFRMRRLKFDGYVNDLDKLTGIEFTNSFKVTFDKYEWYISTMGESFMVVIEVPYNNLNFEYINCTHIDTRLNETDDHPIIFERFLNRDDIDCVTGSEIYHILSHFNNVEYMPELINGRKSIEVELNDSEFTADLSNKDLSNVDEIIIVHMHTTKIDILGIPESFVESDKFDQGLAIGLRNKIKDKERIQFTVGVMGDDPCITKFIRKELV